MSDYDALKKIAESFYKNIHALRVFNEQIGSITEQHDKTKAQEFLSEFSQVVGIPEDEIFEGGRTINIKFKLRKTEDTKNSNIDNHEDNDENKPIEVDKISVDDDDEKKYIVIDDHAKAINLIEFMEDSKKKITSQTRLLRQGALINLVIFYEALVGKLLQYFYLQNPSALPSEGRVLSLSDLREIGTIENAEKFLIDKEIDSIMREGTKSQLDAFIKRSKVNLDSLTDYLSDLTEIIQRRNLFVHNNGVVNRIYLSNVDKTFIEKYKATEGKALVISQTYLKDAIDTICICGTMLIQQSWRKWEKNKESLETADHVIRIYIYETLEEKRWEVVEKLCEYASKLTSQSDVEQRINTINHAIALKEKGKTEQMNNLINGIDWSSCAIRFHVALHVLRDEHEEMIEALRKAVAAEEIDEDALLEWPLFRWFRESDNFAETVQYLFGEDRDENGSVVSP